MDGQTGNEVAWATWKFIDDFLKKERDSFLSAVTHIQLGFAAAVILSIFLGGYSFLSPLAGVSGDSEELGGEMVVFVFALGLTVVLVLGISLYALNRIRYRLIESLEKELHSKAKAIWSTSERFNLEIPPATTELLKSIEKL